MQLTARFSDALAYACQLHATQVRKGSGVPYVAHLLSVAALVLEHGASEDEAIAAVLHDAVEDQGGAAVRDEIAERFGSTVADIVDGCTDTDLEPKPPWQQRKEQYLDRLPDAGHSVQLVSAADKLHNARSLVEDFRRHGDALWPRFTAGKQGTLWYYRSVTDALAGAQCAALVEELDRVVSELERMARRTHERK